MKKSLVARLYEKVQGKDFTSVQRSMIVWEFLMRIPYEAEECTEESVVNDCKSESEEDSYDDSDDDTEDDSEYEEEGKVGIVRLLNNEAFKAAYPLHDGKYDNDGTGIH